jgi:hypothetical protein
MRIVHLLLGAAAAVSLAGVANAGDNLVKNGGFEITTLSGSSEFSTDYQHGVDTVADWTTNGYNMLVMPGAAQTSGIVERYDTMTLWSPQNGSNNGFVDSPAGGNYIAAAGAYITQPISQTITGLNPDETYTLSFIWAGAQQHGYSGTGFALQDGSVDPYYWSVSLGDQTFVTDGRANTSEGFLPWDSATFTFTPTSAAEVLSFLAHGPTAAAPFALLDAVSLTPTAAVPEPAVWSMMILGFGVIGGVLRARRRRTAVSA